KAPSRFSGKPDPKFSAPITNVTVPVGRDAILTCLVHELVAYKVAWLRVDTQTILTIQNHVITKNHRIGISHTEHRIWQLRIREVSESDRGWYMCQINTDPMKSQVGYLDVVVSPDIIDYQTSHDIAVQEGHNVTFVCTASGLPTPVITWRREKEAPLITTTGGRKIFSVEGPNLTICNVNRHHMGAYLCIASNGVPPTVSKRVLLIVNFAPKLWSRYDRIYAAIGQRVILECISESHPLSINYWLKDKEFVQGGTYELDTLDNVHKIVMRLTVRPAKVKEFGEYKCVSKNLFGETERTTYLYHKSKMNSNELKRTNLEDNDFILVEDILSRNSGLDQKLHMMEGFINIIAIFLINNSKLL
ncbi:limbic system-associated membrane protein, partial [Eupeodes corollae]|uniref:limbic system-associated membrane protein n=1 Tax=Eupeodes corollae TaxID=290404 RepID=UPI002490855F